MCCCVSSWCLAKYSIKSGYNEDDYIDVALKLTSEYIHKPSAINIGNTEFRGIFNLAKFALSITIWLLL